MPTKLCCKCKIEKFPVEFSKDAGRKDKLQSTCKLCKAKQQEELQKNNPTYHSKYRKQSAEYQKQWNKNNPEYRKQYREAHKKERAIYIKQWRKEKERKDPIFRLVHHIRNRFNFWFSGNKKSKRTFEYINCSKEELVFHLESLFQDGMTWENYGKWHVDHKLPLSIFDPTKEEDMNKAWAKENLQPLWAKDNLSKGRKL